MTFDSYRVGFSQYTNQRRYWDETNRPSRPTMHRNLVRCQQIHLSVFPFPHGRVSHDTRRPDGLSSKPLPHLFDGPSEVLPTRIEVGAELRWGLRTKHLTHRQSKQSHRSNPLESTTQESGCQPEVMGPGYGPGLSMLAGNRLEVGIPDRHRNGFGNKTCNMEARSEPIAESQELGIDLLRGLEVIFVGLRDRNRFGFCIRLDRTVVDPPPQDCGGGCRRPPRAV